MADKVTLSMIDYSEEGTSSQWHMTDITAVNYVAQLALQDAIRAAIEAISLCNERNLSASLVWHSAAGLPPTNVLAQREFAVRVFYTDTTTNDKYSMTIPGADFTLLDVTKDEIKLADGSVMQDFVTAFEAGAKSKNGNAVAVTSARVVGRNT